METPSLPIRGRWKWDETKGEMVPLESRVPVEVPKPPETILRIGQYL